jgi:hypothetical protein
LLFRSTQPYPESKLSAKTRTVKVAGVREEEEVVVVVVLLRQRR